MFCLFNVDYGLDKCMKSHFKFVPILSFICSVVCMTCDGRADEGDWQPKIISEVNAPTGNIFAMITREKYQNGLLASIDTTLFAGVEVCGKPELRTVVKKIKCLDVLCP